MIRFRRGTALLNNVVKTFDRMVADLEVADQQIEAERLKLLDTMEMKQAKHRAKIAKLQADHADEQEQLSGQEYNLWLAGYRAKHVRRNILSLVGAE